MHKKTLFSRAGRLAVAVSGALALAGAALPANASTLRIAMTAADIPLTLGQPDQGYEGNRFTGIPLYDALVDQVPFLFVAHDVGPRAISPAVTGVVQPQSWFIDLSLVSKKE